MTKASKLRRCEIHSTRRKAQTIGHHHIVQHRGHMAMHVMSHLCLRRSLKSPSYRLERALMVIRSLLSARTTSGVMMMTTTMKMRQRIPGREVMSTPS